MLIEGAYPLLQRFFKKPACQKATAPLREGASVCVVVSGERLGLIRRDGKMEVTESAPEKADMTFELPIESLRELADNPTEDIGELGIALLQLMAHSDPARRMGAKVHIGPFELLTRGYLGVLPLGGGTVMKYLASKGFTGISKIREGISRMRG